MPSPLKKPESVYDIIFNTVTVKDQKAVQETAKKCKKLFKQKDSPADPNVLTELEKVLRARQDEQALAKHINPSKQGNSPKTQDELKESLKKQREDYERYIQHFLPALKAEITESKKLDSKKKAAIVQTILDITNRSRDESRSSVETAAQSTNVAEKSDNKGGHTVTSGSDSDSGIDSPKTSKESLESPINSRRSSLTLVTSTSSKESLNSTSNSAGEAISSFKRQKSVRKKKHSAEVLGNAKSLDNTNTPKISGDSDSGLETSEESLKSPVSSSPISVTSTSSQEGLNSTSSSAGEDNGLQSEDEGETKLVHLTKTRSKGPSGRRSPSKYNKKIEDQMQPEQVVKEELKLNSEKSGSTLPGKEELKLEEQKKEAVLSEQSAPDNNNNDKEVLSKKQPNNRNLHVALVAGCALLAVGCLVAGAMTSGLVGAGLLVMATVFAIATAVTWYLTPPSSELTSTNLSRPVDDKELTACSHL